MKQLSVLLFCLLLFFSCAETTTLTFIESNSLYENNAVVEINIPKAEGNTLQSIKINSVIENHIANMLVFLEEPSDTLQLMYAINSFDSEYKSFKEGFGEGNMVWDASFDGEVTYQSSEIISVAIYSYLNSGGAHGNSNVTFLNFNSVGDLLEFDDIFQDKKGLTTLATTHFENEIDGSEINYFFGEAFHLPANIGFNDEGVIFFYNVYEIASYADGITEFTIPFLEIDNYLKLF